jgi:hypothetical protein
MKQNNITMEELIKKFRIKYKKYNNSLYIGDKVKFIGNSTSILGLFNSELESEYRIDGNGDIKPNVIGTVAQDDIDNHYWIKYRNALNRDMCLAFHKDNLIKIK